MPFLEEGPHEHMPSTQRVLGEVQPHPVHGGQASEMALVTQPHVGVAAARHDVEQEAFRRLAKEWVSPGTPKKS